MSTYGGVGEIKNPDDKKGRSALLAGLGAVSALLVVIAFAASHLTTSQVNRVCLDCVTICFYKSKLHNKI